MHAIIMLQVDTSEVWLKDECNELAFFPNDIGQFTLQEITPYSTLLVEGPTTSGLNLRMGFQSSIQHTGTSQSIGSTLQQQATGSCHPGPPMFRSVVASRKPAVTLIKIMKAKMSPSNSKIGGKPDFTCTGQLYIIELTESTANVTQVCEAVHRQWGTEYTVVSTEGLEIDDSLATQGQYMHMAVNCILISHPAISFWKCPRRKLYAVTHSDIQECRSTHKSSRSLLIDDADSSDEDIDLRELPARKRKYDDKLQWLADEVASIKEILTDMMSVTANSTLPIGWRCLFCDAFKCQICHSIPIKPPIIVTKCCRNILGCQECVNTWYSGPEAMTRTCPVCRAERGCNETMLLHGSNEFM